MNDRSIDWREILNKKEGVVWQNEQTCRRKRILMNLGILLRMDCYLSSALLSVNSIMFEDEKLDLSTSSGKPPSLEYTPVTFRGSILETLKMMI